MTDSERDILNLIKAHNELRWFGNFDTHRADWNYEGRMKMLSNLRNVLM